MGKRLQRINIPLLLASGVAMGINWILLFQAYRYTTISAATLSYYFTPVIATVASPLLFREKLTAKQILCFCMSTLGLVMIIGINNLTRGGSDLTGIGWACLLIVRLVHTGVTYCMYFSALKDLPGQEAAILSYIDPLVAVIVSVLILGESMTILQFIGGVLFLGFTLWNEK